MQTGTAEFCGDVSLTAVAGEDNRLYAFARQRAEQAQHALGAVVVRIGKALIKDERWLFFLI